MLFQPTNVIPSTLSGEGAGTIDATKPLTVSWQVNGNSPMTAYRIKIMQNDTDSTLKLDTGKVTLSTPFYGADALGNPKAYSVIISAAQMSTAGITNGYANGYKMTIQQWWTANDSIEQTSASYFITRADPSVTLAIIPYRNSFRQLEHTFQAYYSQAQGDNVEWVRWELQSRQNGDYETIDDTGRIYNPGMVYSNYYNTIEYTYNGFLPGVYEDSGGTDGGVKYRIQCTVQTESGVQASTGWEEFTTQYFGNHSYTAELGLCMVRERDAVKISMPPNFPIKGAADGAYTYQEGTTKYNLNLGNGSTVTWGGEDDDALKTDASSSTILLKGIITSTTADANYFKADYHGKELAFAYDGSGFRILYDGDVIWSTNIAPVLNATFGIALMDEKAYFLMKNGTTVKTAEAIIPAWRDNAMQSITIQGPMVFDSIEVIDGNIQWVYFYNAITSDYYAATMNKNTIFIAAFDNTLYTGDSSIGASGTGRNGSTINMTTNLCVCRKEKLSELFSLVAEIALNDSTKDTAIYDYTAKNQAEYEYYMLYMWENNYIRDSTGISSIIPCWWNYTVLCCSTNNIGNFIVESEYRFAMDISSGNVGNNNSPALQQNFTRYPLRQPVSNNYRSGSLSAFIGKVVNDQYVDTASLMDELYALSTKGQTKFLKTRKGQIFRIETSAPIAMGIGDKYAQQPAKISLPWVEVGDASGANILGDTAFIMDAPTFSVDPETMELSMQYSNASAMGAGSFSLTDGDLYLMNPGVSDLDADRGRCPLFTQRQ